MDISNYIKQQGSFLKAEHVNAQPKDTVWIMDTSEAEMVTSEKYGTERLHIHLTNNGQTFVFDMSKTNARTIEKELGSDTTKWNGHGLVLETYKTKTSEGKMTDAINVQSVKRFV